MHDAPQLADLERWLSRRGFPVRSLEPLAGDVSARHYVRIGLADGSTAVAALYPPELAGACRRFLASGELLATAGVAVPRVLAAACGRGLMLLEDVGPRTLYDRADRPWSELAPWLERAAEIVHRVGHLPAAELAELNPVLGRTLLRRELEQTWERFLEPRSLTGGPELAARLRRALDTLCERLAAPAPAPCHRDLMARNLVPRPDGGLVVLDHQDLRLGPPFYDLASLLNDSLFPPAAVAEPILAAALGDADDRLAYHRAAAQRGLKAVGTFAAFAARGDERHLPLVAPTLARALDHLARVPETAPLAPTLSRRWSQVSTSRPHRGG